MVISQPHPTKHMITNLSAQNVKGRTFSHDLGAITIFTGQQGTGKTARLDALRLALLGYHPDLGKTGKSIWQLAEATADNLTVSVRTPSGDLCRVWKPKGKSIAATTTGIEPATPPACLDGSLFMQATTTARAALVRQLFPSAESPHEAIRAAITAVAPDIALAWPRPGDDLNAWLDDVQAAIKAAQTAARETRDRMTKAIEAAAQLAPESYPTADEMPNMDAARALTETAAKEVSKLEALQQKTKAELEHMAATIAELEAKIPAVPPCAVTEEQINAAQTEVQRLRRAVEGAESWSKTIASQTTERRRLESLLADFSTAYPQAIPEPATLDHPTPSALALSAPAKAAAHAAALAAWKAAQERAEEADICPHCGAGREHWAKQHASHSAPTVEDIENLRQATLAAEHDRAKAEEAHADHLAELAAYEAAREGHQQAVKSWRAFTLCKQRADDAAAALENFAQFAPPANLGDHEQLALELDAAEAELEDMTRAQAAAHMLKTLQETRAKATADGEALEWLASDLELARANYTAARAAFDAAVQATNTRASALAAEQQKAAAQEAREKADKADGQAVLALQTLKTQFTELAGAALAPLLAAANCYLEGTELEPLDAIGLDIGRWKGATWIAWDVFSGGEKAIATTAIQAAIAETASTGWRIATLDEFNVVSGNENRRGLLRNLAQAIHDGRLDQAVILDNQKIYASETADAEELATVEIIALT